MSLCTYTGSSQHFSPKGNLSFLFIHMSKFIAHKVVDSKLDSFLRSNPDQLRYQASIQPQHAFVANHFLQAVPAVLVHQLANHRTRPLILQTCLHQINRIDSRSTNSWKLSKLKRYRFRDALANPQTILWGAWLTKRWPMYALTVSSLYKKKACSCSSTRVGGTGRIDLADFSHVGADW